MIYPQPHDPTDNDGDTGIVGCGQCGKHLERQEAFLVADDRIYLCPPCDEVENNS